MEVYSTRVYPDHQNDGMSTKYDIVLCQAPLECDIPVIQSCLHKLLKVCVGEKTFHRHDEESTLPSSA